MDPRATYIKIAHVRVCEVHSFVTLTLYANFRLQASLIGVLFCINQCTEVHESGTVTTSYTSERSYYRAIRAGADRARRMKCLLPPKRNGGM